MVHKEGKNRASYVANIAFILPQHYLNVQTFKQKNPLQESWKGFLYDKRKTS